MFNSSLATEMLSYLELRSACFALGTVSVDKSALISFDQHLCEKNFKGKNLNEEIVTSWSLTLFGKSETIKNKIGVIRKFARYLNSLGIHSFIPELPIVKSDFIPYIYSDQELQLIFYYADHLTSKKPHLCSSHFNLKIPMAIRILYGCGTRIGETMALQRKDIDLQNGTIFLRNTKFSKERMIPMHDSLRILLERYCLVLGILDKPDAYLFPGRKKDSHFTPRQMETWFARILELANIDQENRRQHKYESRLHCFRHLFVLKSMQQIESSGRSVDMNDLLLPTYLGHECLLDTDKYMRFSGVQVADNIEAFETFTLGLIPTVEVAYEE